MPSVQARAGEAPASGSYDSGKDIDLDSNNTNPVGLWSDGTTLWVADSDDNKLYAYGLSGGSYDSSKNLDLASGNTEPQGVASDGARLFVADSDDTVYVYRPPPVVTLELSSASVPESGGTVQVTASLDWAATDVITVTVVTYLLVGETLSKNIVLTIPTGMTASSGLVEVTVRHVPEQGIDSANHHDSEQPDTEDLVDDAHEGDRATTSATPGPAGSGGGCRRL